MGTLQHTVGEYGLYEHNITILREVGEQYKVVKLRSVRKKGLECARPTVVKTDAEKANYSKLEAATSRAKRMAKEYALCNDFDWFVTLTIDPEKFDRYNLQTYYKSFSEFVHNYNRRCKEGEKVRFILIPEMHKDGAWHMHGLIKGIRPKDVISNEYGYFDWKQYSAKFGFISLDTIKNKRAVSNYITKYITKDLGNAVKEYGAHLYYHSRGLQAGTNLYRGQDLQMSCDWDYERPDGFCKVKWFDTADSLVEVVSIVEPESICYIDE